MARKTQKKSNSKGPATTRKIGGSTFKRKSCHTSKSAAKKAAEAIRGRGYKARVIGGCVYQGPRSKRKTKA